MEEIKMRKNILPIFVAIIVLSFVSCGGEREPARDDYITNEPELNITEEEPTHTQSWQEAYSAVLSKYYNETAHLPAEEAWLYTLHDINGDSVPDIIIWECVATFFFAAHSAYTFSGGEACRLEIAEGFGGSPASLSVFSFPGDTPGMIVNGSGELFWRQSLVNMEGNSLVVDVCFTASVSRQGRGYDDILHYIRGLSATPTELPSHLYWLSEEHERMLSESYILVSEPEFHSLRDATFASAIEAEVVFPRPVGVEISTITAIEPANQFPIPALNLFPAPPRFDAPQIQITDAGRTAAMDFLSEYTSLFGFGEFNKFTETYINYFTGEILAERPLVLLVNEYEEIRPGAFELRSRRFYDRDENVIEDVVFLRGQYFIATDFILYALDNSGFPAIFILWEDPDTCSRGYEMHHYIDGEYVFMGWLKSSLPFQFFHSHDGRIVVFYNSELDSLYGSYFLNIANELHHEEIVAVGYDEWHDIRAQWKEFHGYYEWNHDTHEHIFIAGEFSENPRIFGTNLPLAPIEPLSVLRNEIISFHAHLFRN
jgi:hypothetical protein